MVLWVHDKIIERWKGYYGKLLKEDNRRTVIGDEVAHKGLTPEINREEVGVALKIMKVGGTRRNSSELMEEVGRRRGR